MEGIDRSNKVLYLILSHNIKVKTVQIDGLKSVKDDVVIPHLEPLLKPRNLLALIDKISTVRSTLEGLDAFENIDVSIDHLQKTSDINEVALRIAVSEASTKKWGMNLNSDAGMNDGSFVVYGQLRNLFGRLESLNLNYTKGTKISSGYDITFNKPILTQKNSHVKGVIAAEQALNRTAGFMTSDLRSNILYQLDLLGGSNIIEGGALWQQIHGTNAPIKLREEFGHHLKCSLRHTYLRDTRDDNLVATRGYRCHLATEVAGFMGDVNHVKVNADTQLNFPLFLGLTGTLNLRAGLLHRTTDDNRTWITDKFFCGGPGSVRGFFTDGIGGPVGGTAHWGAGLSLTRPLPFSPHIWGLGRFMRMHNFINAGSLVSDRYELFKNPRLSVGSGLIIKVGNAMKMEINYAVPLKYEASDVVNHGLQFGIGVNFM